MTAPPLPSIAELDALPFRDAVARLMECVEWVLGRYRARLAVRQAEGRTLPEADTERLRALALSLSALRVDVLERLEPGATERAIDAAYAALADAMPEGRA